MERDILIYLLAFYSAGDYIGFHSLSPVLEKSHKGDDLIYFFERIKSIITHLSNQGFIELSNKKDENQYGSWGAVKEVGVIFDYNNLPTYARLTPEGRGYIQNILTIESQINASKSVIITNRIIWVNIVLSLIFSGILIVFQIQTNNRERERDIRESHKEDQERLLKEQQAKYETLLDKYILLKEYYGDSSKKKKKIK